MNMITEKDLCTLTQNTKDLHLKAEVLNEKFETIKNIEGSVISGNYSVDADSDVRRTCSITIQLDKCDMDFTQKLLFQYYLRVSIGYYSYFAHSILYYCIGIYSFDNQSTQYDEETHTLSLSMVDMMGKLDSEHTGTLYGALTPAIYACDPITGQRKEHSELILRNIVIGLLKDFGIKNYIVDDIGNHTHSNTETARWDELPYDLEFSTGSSLLDVLSAIRDLYPFYEMFFDVEGTFHFQQMPVLEEDICVLDETILDPLVISEQTSLKVYDVKNIIDFWGKDLDADRFASNDAESMITYSDGVYYVSLESFTESDYVDGLLIGIKIPSDNSHSETSLNINRLGSKPIKDPMSGLSLEPDSLKKDTVYIFQYRTSINGFYFLGNYQVHAVSILTNGAMNKDAYSTVSERKEYFKKKFNTNAVRFLVNPENPCCIESVGWVVQSISGGDYAGINSDSAALSCAEYLLWQKSRRADAITLETILIPWLDVNQKIKYRKQGETKAEQYLIKSIQADFNSCTMTMELIRFYDLFLTPSQNFNEYLGEEQYSGDSLT